MNRAILYIIFSQVFFVIAWCLIKILGDRIPLFEMIFIRAILSSIILIVLCVVKKRALRVHSPIALTIRALLSFISMSLMFYSMTHMELGNAAMLSNTMPFFAILLAFIFLREPCSIHQGCFLTVGLIGVTMILKPNLSIVQIPALAALFSAITGAASMVLIRRLKVNDSVYSIALFYTLFMTIVSLPMCISSFVLPTLSDAILLFIMGVALTGGQLCMVRAYTLANVGIVAPYTYLSVIGAYLLGIIFFGDSQSMLSFVGSGLIVFSGIQISRVVVKKPILDTDGG